MKERERERFGKKIVQSLKLIQEQKNEINEWTKKRNDWIQLRSESETRAF